MSFSRLWLQLTLMLMSLFPAGALAQPQAVRLVAVTDGDTMIVLGQRGRLTVRLAGIDAPDIRQRNGIRARQTLIALCSGEAITIETRSPSTRPETARVTCNGRDVSAELVTQGLAWVTSAAGDASFHAGRLQPLEDEARAARRGVWADANPVAPWDWKPPPRKPVP